MIDHKVDQENKKLFNDNTITIFFQHAYVKTNEITKESVENEGFFNHPLSNEIGFVGKTFINNTSYSKKGGFDKQWREGFLKHTIKQYNNHPIIKIVLSGEQDNNVADGTILNADRLKELIESLDLKNKILVFDNITCQGANYLPKDNMTVFERIKTIIQELDGDKQPNELHLGYQANGFRNMTNITNRQVYTKEDYFCEKKQYDFLQATNIKKISFNPLGMCGVNQDKNEKAITEYNDNLLECINKYKQITHKDAVEGNNIKNDNYEINNENRIIDETQQTLQQNNQYNARCSFKWYYVFMPWKWCSCSSKDAVAVIDNENINRRGNAKPKYETNAINNAAVYNIKT